MTRNYEGDVMSLLKRLALFLTERDSLVILDPDDDFVRPNVSPKIDWRTFCEQCLGCKCALAISARISSVGAVVRNMDHVTCIDPGA